ncbi:hypothetical protein HanIR_Chr02g0062121 [Helianthus annuus]|nr:hypothetical protein HanIR_Chr02g0062121 [Helianthus annuus]
MCEICGGPHFTVKCPQYEGSSTPYYANPFVQPQPYFSQGYSLQFYDHRPYYNDLYQQPQHYQGQTSDRGLEGSLSRIEEMFAQFMARDQGYSTYQYDDPYQQSLRAERNLHFEEMLRQQEEMAVESAKIRKILNALEAKVEPEITMDVSAPPPVQQEDREENTGQFIIDFSCSNEEIDAQLAAYKRWKGEDLEEVEEEVEKEKVQPEKPTTGYTYDAEGNYLGYMLSTRELIPTFPELGKELPYEEWSDEEITSVTETKMDEVPPPVPQVSIINYWSDSDDDIDEEEWAAYQRSLVKKKVIEDEVELGDSTGRN